MFRPVAFDTCLTNNMAAGNNPLSTIVASVATLAQVHKRAKSTSVFGRLPAKRAASPQIADPISGTGKYVSFVGVWNKKKLGSPRVWI